MTDTKKRGMWARALHLAELTPASRNRYVDLLRAIAITCVVLGHWTMAAPWIRDGHATIEHLLTIVPWTRWLTWCFQVMPVFFFVGGFSNGTSWRSAQRRELPWRDWFASRLQRLLGPTLVLVAFWVVGSMIALPLGVHPEFVRVGSQISLIPTWFLAVYILVCMVVPWTHAWWQRSGYTSVAVLVAGAIVMDALFFLVPSLRWLTWANYLFIWLAVHQLGYAWLDGLRGGGRSLVWGLASLGALFAMVLLGPWPISLVGVPGETLPGTDVVLSNTRPPKLPLLALGVAQIGLLLALQGPAKQWLARRVPWAATVLANGMIMTVFLWHSTAMMLLFGVGFLLGGIGWGPEPGTAAWWSIRPLWIAAFMVGTIPFVAVFQRFERVSGRSAPGVARLIIGCILTCVGLALLAISGLDGEGVGSLPWVPIVLPFIGCGIAGFGPLGALEARLRGETPAR